MVAVTIAMENKSETRVADGLLSDLKLVEQ